MTLISGDPSLEAFLYDLRVVQTQAWHLHTPLRPCHIGSYSCRSLQHTKRGQTKAIFVHYFLDFYHSTVGRLTDLELWKQNKITKIIYIYVFWKFCYKHLQMHKNT